MRNTRRIRLVVVFFMLAVVGLLSASWAPNRAATVLTTGLDCYALGHGRMQCEATPEGGTGSYVSYAWTPTPTAGGGALMISNCTQWHYYTASVTVTDSDGATASASGTFYCGTPQ